MRINKKKTVSLQNIFMHLRTTKKEISLRIRTVSVFIIGCLVTLSTVDSKFAGRPVRVVPGRIKIGFRMMWLKCKTGRKKTTGINCPGHVDQQSFSNNYSRNYYLPVSVCSLISSNVMLKDISSMASKLGFITITYSGIIKHEDIKSSVLLVSSYQSNKLIKIIGQ